MNTCGEIAPTIADASRRAVIAGALALAACGRPRQALSADQIGAFSSAASQLPPVPALPRTLPPPALRDLTGVPIGVCFNPDFAPQANYVALVARQFSQLTPEWNFQMPAILQADGSYNWSIADGIVAFARDHQQSVHAHSLVWYAADEVPWFQALDGRPEAFAAAYRTHILNVASHFRGAVVGWDVINEPVAENGEGLRDSLWSRNLGAEDYMVRAFEAAGEADPGAILLVNDYNLEVLPNKRITFMRLIDRLRTRGCKVGGVGTQTHLGVEALPGMVTAAIKDLATLGLPIHVSEFDVHFGPVGKTALTTAQKDTVQSELAAETIAAFLGLPTAQQYGFTTWGARDRDSNWNRAAYGGDGTDRPLFFDDQGDPKPAFWAVADRLAAQGKT